MCRFARDGRHLANLAIEAAAVCRAAEDSLNKPRRPGRPDTFQQWQIASLIFIAVAHHCKSKSSQYRFLQQHQASLRQLPLRRTLRLEKLPSRATYMRRYAGVHELVQEAIRIGGRRAIQEHAADARTVAIDKSLIPARGPRPPRRWQRPRAGVDHDAAFCKSVHDGWVWGYSYEIVVSAPAANGGLVVPLLASADRANCSEHRSGPIKVRDLPRSVRHVLADGGYDSNHFGEVIEYTPQGRRTGRRLICPLEHRGGKPCVGLQVRKGRRERLRQHRAARHRFIQSKRGKRLFARRRRTVEPLNQWFKNLFDLEHHVWHRGLGDNRTTLLTALFCYQLLQRYNHAQGHRDGTVAWILDAL